MQTISSDVLPAINPKDRVGGASVSSCLGSWVWRTERALVSGDISALNFLIDSSDRLVTRLQRLKHKCISRSFFFNLESKQCAHSITGQERARVLEQQGKLPRPLDAFEPDFQGHGHSARAIMPCEGCLKQRKLRSECLSHTSRI